MQITICDRGCGKTSLDSDAAIEKMSVRLSQNGDEPMPEMNIMACAACRQVIRIEIGNLFTPARMTVKVEDRIMFAKVEERRK